MKYNITRILAGAAVLSLAAIAGPYITSAKPGDPLPASVIVDTINGLPPTGHCIAGTITVVGHGIRGENGGPYSIDVGNGSGATTTVAVGSGASGAYTFTATFTPLGSTTGLIINLYHGSPSGNDSHSISVNQCVAPPTQGVLTVSKYVASGTATSADFTLHVKQGEVDVTDSPFAGIATGKDFQLLPGTYAVSEDAKANYTQTSLVCTNVTDGTPIAGSNVELVAGKNYACAITNDYVAPGPDTTPPVIDSHGDVTVEATSAAGATAAYAAPNAVDDADGTFAATCAPVSGSAFVIGDTTVTCDAQDVAGNSATSTTFVVHVVDTTPPVITLNGSTPISLTVGDTYSEAGATAADIVDGTDPVTVGGDTVNTATPGTYTVTYDAVDAAGNNAVQVTRTVTVSAITPVDVCTNIEGVQATVPEGMTEDGGICTPITTPTDVCTNIEGVQTTVPEGMTEEGGICTETTTPPSDVCSNIEGNQSSVPAGMTEKDGVCTETPVSRGGGGGGGCAPGFVFNPVTLKCDPRGQVLGASTSQVLGVSCGLFMDQHLKIGSPKNNPGQVTKLQAFLNKYGFANFTPTGYFGPKTLAAVNAFQQKYAADILTPWNISKPTGLVYLTTIRTINLIECPDLMLKMPELVPWSSNPNAQ